MIVSSPLALLSGLVAGALASLAGPLRWVFALAAWLFVRSPATPAALVGALARTWTAFQTFVLPGEAAIALRLGVALSASVDAALVDLGVPAALCAGEGPQPVPALATRLGCDPASLFRLLRAGAATGVVSLIPGGEEDDDTATVRFAPNRLTRALASGPARAVALVHARHLAPAYARLADGVRAGTDAYSLAHGGTPFWTRLAETGDETTFSQAMAAGDGLVSPSLLAAARDWKGVSGRVLDLGGAHGSCLARLLDLCQPSVCGVLFDTPAVAASARAAWLGAGDGSTQLAALASARVDFVGGDLFAAATLPALNPGDVAVLRFILHDWSDADAARILGGLRSRVKVEGDSAATTAIATTSMDAARGPRVKEGGNGGSSTTTPPTVCLLELVLPPPAAPPPHPALALSDINMLAAVRGGRERTLREWEGLLAAGGWKLIKVTPVGIVCLLEAVPAQASSAGASGGAGEAADGAKAK